MPLFIARILVVVEADDEADACDTFSETLSENLKANGAIVDWGYSIDEGGKDYSGPREMPEPWASAIDFAGEHITLDPLWAASRRETINKKENAGQ